MGCINSWAVDAGLLGRSAVEFSCGEILSSISVFAHSNLFAAYLTYLLRYLLREGDRHLTGLLIISGCRGGVERSKVWKAAER